MNNYQKINGKLSKNKWIIIRKNNNLNLNKQTDQPYLQNLIT